MREEFIGVNYEGRSGDEEEFLFLKFWVRLRKWYHWSRKDREGSNFGEDKINFVCVILLVGESGLILRHLGTEILFWRDYRKVMGKAYKFGDLIPSQ